MAPSDEPKVPGEKPDPEGARNPSGGSDERPGLGRAKGDRDGGAPPEGGPVRDTALGAGRATAGSASTSAKGVKG